MRWTVDRAISLLAGSFILFSLALGRFHDRRWRLMTVLIGANMVLRSTVGWCPSSLALRKLGVPETWATAGPGGAPEHAPVVRPSQPSEAEVLVTAR